MTSLAERVPVDRISAEAREVRFARTVLVLIAAFFFGVGWLAGKTWLAVAWAATAVKLGWQEARISGSTRRPAG